MECDGAVTRKEMVASLQSRKEALESKLREKNEELKALCIQEAELTGVLPPETPIEPGESPPSFRRRIGTAFTYPENLINKLRSKEEESLAALELECKIQTGIAEAALGLANDGTASKSVRRKHRLMYQQSQRRLMELETRLSFLRQCSNNNSNNSCSSSTTSGSSVVNNNNNNDQTSNSSNNNNNNNNNSVNPNKGHLKQRKKPRPPLDSDGDCLDENDNGNGGNHHQPLSLSISDRGVLRHSHTYTGSGSPRYYDQHHPSHRQAVRNHTNGYAWQYHHPNTSPDIRSVSCVSYVERDQGYYSPNDGFWYHTAPNPSRNQQINIGGGGGGLSSNEDERSVSNFRYRGDRFGSLDRRRAGGATFGSGSSSGAAGTSWLIDERSEEDRHMSKTLMTNAGVAPPNTVPAILLPNQTYPENSLMRTQSLGLVDHTVSRKTREKEWYETALDSGSGPRPSTATPPPPSPPPPPPLPPPPPPPPPTSAASQTNIEAVAATTHQQLSFDTVVPFESPKNHTVVQAGKWQPYREVTKPFEMADFYKYSTKYRKNNNSSCSNINNITTTTTTSSTSTTSNGNNREPPPQLKAIYQPLQPMTCQPILQTLTPPPAIPAKERREVPNQHHAQLHHCHPSQPLSLSSSASPSSHPSQLQLQAPSLADAFSSEMLAWYQDQSVTQSRSATLV